jgi:beta-galactosidase
VRIVTCRLLPSAPLKVEGIPVSSKAARIYFLHGTEFGSPTLVAEGTRIADYVMHYADASEATMPVVLGDNIRDWRDFDDGKPVTRGRVVWTGTNHRSEQQNRTLRLFLAVWDNPHPEKLITNLDFVSAKDGPCAPFCMAIRLPIPTCGR